MGAKERLARGKLKKEQSMRHGLIKVLLGVWCACSLLLEAQAHNFEDLSQELHATVAELASKATIGVALIIDGQDVITVNNDRHYPLMSVMKFHQGLAVAHYLKSQHLPLNTPVPLSAALLKSKTYSPLQEHYPPQDLLLPVSELLRYSLQLSDNVACDALFDFIGGPGYVDAYLRTIGATDFAIGFSEAQMQHSKAARRGNWSTPLSTAQLWEMLYTTAKTDQYLNFIFTTLQSSPTGKARLPAALAGTNAKIAHKTGTSGREDDGRYLAINDAGVVLLPDGRHYSLVILVTDSSLSVAQAEEQIAKLGRIVYRHLSATHDGRESPVLQFAGQ